MSESRERLREVRRLLGEIVAQARQLGSAEGDGIVALAERAQYEVDKLEHGYRCVWCHAKFSTDADIREHVAEVHPAERAEYAAMWQAHETGGEAEARRRLEILLIGRRA